jgi:hypothetical protein
MIKIHPVTYLAVIAIVTIFTAIIYVTVQQSYRSNANDPQLQIAGDILNRLDEGKSIDHFMQGDTVDIAKSLSVFKVLYDSNKIPVHSTGLLDGKLPQLPKGVFDFAMRNMENVFTWQPKNGVRVAMVLKATKAPYKAFVGVGRSLIEVERRESNLTTMVITAWIIALAVILFHFLAISFFKKLEEQN